MNEFRCMDSIEDDDENIIVIEESSSSIPNCDFYGDPECTGNCNNCIYSCC